MRLSITADSCFISCLCLWFSVFNIGLKEDVVCLNSLLRYLILFQQIHIFSVVLTFCSNLPAGESNILTYRRRFFCVCFQGFMFDNTYIDPFIYQTNIQTCLSLKKFEELQFTWFSFDFIFEKKKKKQILYWLFRKISFVYLWHLLQYGANKLAIQNYHSFSSGGEWNTATTA